MTRLGVMALLVLTACASSSPRDMVPASKDIRIVPDARTAEDTYVYIARRPHGVVALAEARQMNDEEARAIVDQVADDLERCIVGLEAQHVLAPGAARVVAIAGENGVPALNVKLAPGDTVAQNALLCLAAPVRATTFPRAGAGLAIEATWGK